MSEFLLERRQSSLRNIIRQSPIGISIVGGLLVSQALTLFTAPVVYLYVERVRLFFPRRKSGGKSLKDTARSNPPLSD